MPVQTRLRAVASAHRVCHGSREAPSARPAPLASVLLFLDTGCQGGLKRNKQRTCTPSARPLSARGLGRLRGSDHPQRLWRQRCRLAAHSFRGSGSRPSGNRVKRRRLAQRRASEEAEFSGVLAGGGSVLTPQSRQGLSKKFIPHTHAGWLVASAPAPTRFFKAA